MLSSLSERSTRHASITPDVQPPPVNSPDLPARDAPAAVLSPKATAMSGLPTPYAALHANPSADAATLQARPINAGRHGEPTDRYDGLTGAEIFKLMM